MGDIFLFVIMITPFAIIALVVKFLVLPYIAYIKKELED